MGWIGCKGWTGFLRESGETVWAIVGTNWFRLMICRAIWVFPMDKTNFKALDRSLILQSYYTHKKNAHNAVILVHIQLKRTEQGHVNDWIASASLIYLSINYFFSDTFQTRCNVGKKVTVFSIPQSMSQSMCNRWSYHCWKMWSVQSKSEVLHWLGWEEGYCFVKKNWKEKVVS